MATEADPGGHDLIGGPCGGAEAGARDATRAMLRARATQVDEIRTAVVSGVPAQRGYRSPTQWLAVVTNEPVGRCRRTVRLAMRLPDLPGTHAAFRDGLLAEAAVEVLVSAWSAQVAERFEADESMLIEWARVLPHDDLRKVIDRWRIAVDPARERGEIESNFERRRLHLSRILDGMYAVDGLLDSDGASVVTNALRQFARRTPLDGRTPAQSRADALVAMAKLALECLAPSAGVKRSRHKVIATVTLEELIRGHGGGTLHTDTASTVTTVERIRAMACDCELHRLVLDASGRVVDYGRATRTVPDHLFELLAVRDQGCRFPGCGAPVTACDAHHATHWVHLGVTELDNLLLCCWFHHHLLHHQHWSTRPLGAGHFQLTDPAGRTHTLRPPMIGVAPPPNPPGATPAIPDDRQTPPAA